MATVEKISLQIDLQHCADGFQFNRKTPFLSDSLGFYTVSSIPWVMFWRLHGDREHQPQQLISLIRKSLLIGMAYCYPDDLSLNHTYFDRLFWHLSNAADTEKKLMLKSLFDNCNNFRQHWWRVLSLWWSRLCTASMINDTHTLIKKEIPCAWSS